jgi:hypothetical protein
MSKDYVAGEKRDQSILFPDTLDEYVSEENPVRFIDAFVDSLDLEQLGFKHSKLMEAPEGLHTIPPTY